MSGYQLTLSGKQHRALHRHLFPGDGLEAAAILLCRDLSPVRQKLVVHEVLEIPYDACRRETDFLTWPGAWLSEAIGRAEDAGSTVILLHSHPGGFFGFSDVDDASDRAVIRGLFSGWSGQLPVAGHGSAIMVPGGEIRARLYNEAMIARDIDRVMAAGDNIMIWWADRRHAPMPMAFGSGMTKTLGELHACVIGVSGTGSVIAEQASRMGFGRVTLIDFDRVEAKNLNRILNSTLEDAERRELKVDSFARAVRRYRDPDTITALAGSILSREAVLCAGACDVLFCCVDTAEGRHIADLISQAMFIPLIDMGVTIPTRALAGGGRAVAEIWGRIDYVQPQGATLADRNVYTPASLRADYLARVDPATYQAELREGYISGAPSEAPSVISLNMRAASAAMLECIARLFPFRHDHNRTKARTMFALAEGVEEFMSEDEFAGDIHHIAAAGLSEPLLGLPDLAE